MPRFDPDSDQDYYKGKSVLWNRVNTGEQFRDPRGKCKCKFSVPSQYFLGL
jgi:hypothetical protein